ncbi:hypothetical protein [Actinomadura flavalba]|uniref:hypothetical protein n=1 Tax=Actinomadura flavalba TaxID=1120938 RepID=UPI0003821076|nr:hypothetical protein [Actinomadura flavalba]
MEQAAVLAAEHVASVADDVEARVALAAAFYTGPAARYGRAELAFLRWEIGRGVLDAGTGSPWWRAVNDRLLRDKAEAALLGPAGRPSSHCVALWRRFLARPSPAAWFTAHNASVVAGYLAHEDLARRETPAERFMINVALLRVLYTHALATAPRLALGLLAPLGGVVGDPRGASVGFFLDLRDAFPEEYPLTGLTFDDLIRLEGALPHALDFGVILPRLPALLSFAAASLPEPRVLSLVRPDGTFRYADLSVAPGLFARRRPLARAARALTAPLPRAAR